MPVAASAEQRAAIIDRLRGAGCVFAEDEAWLLISEAPGAAELGSMVERRVAGVPLEYILGWAEFCGLRIAVEPGVFVPRRRTEFLVAMAAELINTSGIVLDLCCGSGAAGVALAAQFPQIELWAADIDPTAVECARRNIGERGQVALGDLFDALPATLVGRINILVANAPYVPTDAIELMPPEARLFEARIALDGGEDGLDIQRRIAAGAQHWLASGGHLLIETSDRQASTTMEIFASNGLTPTVSHSEELNATVVVGAKA
jgi:release factor glutamine methyltransferase